MVGSSCRPLNLGSVCTQEVITISNSCLETEHVGVGYSRDYDAVPDVLLKPRNRMLRLSYVNVKQLVMLLLAVCLLAIATSPVHTAGAPPEEFCSVCIDTNSDFCCRFFNICCLGKYRLTSTCTWRSSVWYSFIDVSGLKQNNTVCSPEIFLHLYQTIGREFQNMVPSNSRLTEP
jgi:hypothetical protein